jgi:hypothetical protein
MVESINTTSQVPLDRTSLNLTLQQGSNVFQTANDSDISRRALHVRPHNYYGDNSAGIFFFEANHFYTKDETT